MEIYILYIYIYIYIYIYTDFAMCNQKNILTDCGVITRADIGSDHRMVRTKIILNKKLTREKKMKRIRPLNMDLQKLRHLKIYLN